MCVCVSVSVSVSVTVSVSVSVSVSVCVCVWRGALIAKVGPQYYMSNLRNIHVVSHTTK